MSGMTVKRIRGRVKQRIRENTREIIKRAFVLLGRQDQPDSSSWEELLQDYVEVRVHQRNLKDIADNFEVNRIRTSLCTMVATIAQKLKSCWPKDRHGNLVLAVITCKESENGQPKQLVADFTKHGNQQ